MTFPVLNKAVIEGNTFTSSDPWVSVELPSGFLVLVGGMPVLLEDKVTVRCRSANLTMIVTNMAHEINRLRGQLDSME